VIVSQLRSCFSVAPSLTRGRVCLLYMLLALASAVFLRSETLGTRDCLRFETSLFVASYDSQGHGGDRPRRKHPPYCWEGGFTSPLPSNGIYSIVGCVLVTVVICLPSRCLIMDVSSDFTLLAFGHHVSVHL
jgi:hypothetical protein